MENYSESTLKDLLDIFFALPDETGDFRYRPGRFYEFVRAFGDNCRDTKRCALLVNALEREFPHGVFVRHLCGAVFDSVVSFGVLPDELASGNLSSKADFLVSNAFELFREMCNVVFRNDCRMNSVLDCKVFGRKTECVKSHREEHVKALHSLLSCNYVKRCVWSRMTYVKTLS